MVHILMMAHFVDLNLGAKMVHTGNLKWCGTHSNSQHPINSLENEKAFTFIPESNIMLWFLTDAVTYSVSARVQKHVFLCPDLEFWTQLIANDNHTKRFGRFGHFYGLKNVCLCDFWPYCSVWLVDITFT